MPPILDYEGYHRYVDDNLPSESPVLYGLHPNAEVGCLTDASNGLLRALHLLEPSTATDIVQEIPLNNNTSENAVMAASNEEKVKLTNGFTLYLIKRNILLLYKSIFISITSTFFILKEIPLADLIYSNIRYTGNKGF